MEEIDLSIPAGGLLLEARYEKGPGPHTALLCHPHPLYGGNMENNVVLAMKRTLRAGEWGTLRFNFRGVGRSGGNYGDGAGEVEDVLAAAAYLAREGVEALLHIAGYSFGAWVAMKALTTGLDVRSAILASPPLEFLPFDGLRLPEAPCLIALGDRDEFCSPRSLERWLAGLSPLPVEPEVEILRGCDHFYRGHEQALGRRIGEFLNTHF